MFFFDFTKWRQSALTERNWTGPPWSVGRPRAQRPARLPAPGNVTDDDRRRQTPASKTTLAHQAGQ